MNKIPDKLIIAHRGESHLAPGNTLAAINLAWEKGATAVEIDVQLTIDKQIVVIHDENTNRTGDQKKTIKKSRLSELKSVDVGLFKNEEWKGERIPTLAEVLNTVPPNGKIIIEIKCNNEIIPYLISEIKKSQLKIPQVEIISFNYTVISEIKTQIPEYKMLWLLDLDYYYPAWILRINKKGILEKIKKSNLNGINVWAGKVINKQFIEYFKRHGLLVYTWTVNDVEVAERLINHGVDAITTDRPNWLKTQLTNRLA